MGVEWSIGCKNCKHHIWLGSQKPFKWKGFQIRNENAKRFLDLHADCDTTEGNFLLINDGTEDVPWEEDTPHYRTWKEDILSRSYCYDSWKREGMECATCQKKMSDSEDEIPDDSNLQKGTYLWFCDQKCFEDFIAFERDVRENDVYDSSADQTVHANKHLELGCSNCKLYIVVDDEKDINGVPRNFEYFADFLCDHIGHKHSLTVNSALNNAPWKDSDSGQWKEYVY